jgi:hypothetical protein
VLLARVHVRHRGVAVRLHHVAKFGVKFA